MHLRTLRRGRPLVAAAATLGLLGLPLLMTPADAAPGKSKAPAVKVMTRNVYLGADIMRPIVAIRTAQAQHPGNPVAQISAFANANDTTRDIVDQTDFKTRATLLASELVSAKPDLVGLQEVALWRAGEFEDPFTGDPDFLDPNATEVELDFLKILLKELREQGVAYKALSVNTLSDVEGPAFKGAYGSDQQKETAKDVRLTMRDVILQRKGSAAKVVKSAKERTYAVNMPEIQVAGKSIAFERGYQWVDLQLKGRQFRFINTHFEAFSSDVAYAQAQELIDGPGAYKGRTIIVCDCNSDPANKSVKTGQGDTKPHWAPYYLLMRSGFNDTWLQKYAPEEGFTSGLEETVDDPEPTFTHRIDLVLARTKNGDKLPVVNGDVTGDELEDALQREDESLLWPSDHAGVVMKLRLR